mmetsp:Transcript_2298/g.3206  ORF Transcript_2298/g.3206 Transcript_2298/m.3206 type:complete len:229 (-) Transcript_2298:1053-1739(-)
MSFVRQTPYILPSYNIPSTFSFSWSRDLSQLITSDNLISYLCALFEDETNTAVSASMLISSSVPPTFVAAPAFSTRISFTRFAPRVLPKVTRSPRLGAPMLTPPVAVRYAMELDLYRMCTQAEAASSLDAFCPPSSCLFSSVDVLASPSFSAAVACVAEPVVLVDSLGENTCDGSERSRIVPSSTTLDPDFLSPDLASFTLSHLPAPPSAVGPLLLYAMCEGVFAREV